MRKIRVTLLALHFAKPAILATQHSIGIDCTLNGVALGNAADTWPAMPLDSIYLDKNIYSAVIDVEGRKDPLELVVTPHLSEPALVKTIGGPLKQKVPWPFSPRVFTPWREEFTVEWQIENLSETVEVPPEGIYACREDKAGTVLYNTAGDVHHTLRVEVHEVIPAPYGVAAAGPGPMRPTLDTALDWTEGGDGKTKEQLAYGSDLNTVWNPAVIPILPHGAKADATNCAKFRVTYYWPKTMKFDEDDSRLVWSIIGKGNAKFFGRKNGRSVSIHGTSPGEVNLELRFNNTQVAVYRALVAPLITIPYRCSILYGDPTNAQFRPRSTPSEILTHMLICNRLLWQLGITLKPFNSSTIGWLPAAIPAANITPITGMTGFFNATVPPAWTRNDGTIGVALVAAVNSLPYIYNFVYTVLGTGTEGGAGCLMDITGPATLSDSGTPSTSWKRPAGVNPDKAADDVTITAMPKYDMFKNALFPHRFAMYLTDLCPDKYFFGFAIAHETGHILGLNHRIEGTAAYDDKVQYPPLQNVMRWAPNIAFAQDFDIIQAKLTRLSPLLTPPAGARPAPSP